MNQLKLAVLIGAMAVGSITFGNTIIDREKCYIPDPTDSQCFYSGYYVDKKVCVRRSFLGRCLEWAITQTCVWDGGPLTCS